MRTTTALFITTSILGGVISGLFLTAPELEAHEASPEIVIVDLPDIPEVPNIDADELECLAKNVYFEAGNQSTAGRIAVANVTINRVNSDKFPNTICEVVHQGQYRKSWKDENVLVPVLNKCQFSWWCDGKADNPYEGDAWDESQLIALRAYTEWLDNKTLDITDGSMYYHADYVTPYWAKHMIRTVKIGTHIFYH